MFVSINLYHVIVAAIAGFGVGVIFYSLPTLRNRRTGQSALYEHLHGAGGDGHKSLPAMMKWFWNVLINSYVLAGIFNLTGTTTLGMGLVLGLVIFLRSAFTFSGWNTVPAKELFTVRLIDNIRFLLMQIVMITILTFWK